MPTLGAHFEYINRRRRRRTLTAAAVACVLLAATQPAWASGDPGDAGALFLRIGMGARASAMGEGYIAVAEDASSVYWNPAAMAAVLGTYLQFTHDEYMLSARVEQLALTHETRYGTLGLSFTGMYMDDMERREEVPTAMPLGTFSVYDASFAVGFARYILPNTSLGATAKPVYQKIDAWSASSWAFDIGIFHVARIDGLKLAAVGLVFGLVGVFAATKLTASMVYGVSPTDPKTIVGGIVFLVLIGLLGSLVPARRATRVDPVLALREE